MADWDLESMNVDFEMVVNTYTSPSEVRRRSAGCDVARSGYCETNTNGTVELDKLLALSGGKAEDQFSVKFGANRAKGLVAVYPAKDGEDGATTAKRSKDKKCISFHIGHIFGKHPTLRPAGEVFCIVKLGKDAKGVPCVIINLRGGTPKKGRPASSSDDSSDSASTTASTTTTSAAK